MGQLPQKGRCKLDFFNSLGIEFLAGLLCSQFEKLAGRIWRRGAAQSICRKALLGNLRRKAVDVGASSLFVG